MNILFLDTKMLEKKTKYTNKLQMLATEMQTNHIKKKNLIKNNWTTAKIQKICLKEKPTKKQKHNLN